MSEMKRVLFVCMGNICRSPTAEAVFRHLIAGNPIAGKMEIDSAGTIGSHAGAKADPRAVALGRKHGYDLAKLRARQVVVGDFTRFDYVIAMDVQNVVQLKAVCPPELAHKIDLLMAFAPGSQELEVPDPYYGSAADFAHALTLIERGCNGLLRHITHPQAVRSTWPAKVPGKRAS